MRARVERPRPIRGQRNQVRGVVEPPRPEDVPELPPPGSPEHERLAAVGAAAIRRGELAFCVLAGGMATRMGGVVKALVEALDGHTFLDLRLGENATWSRRAGAPVPLWLMTSEATDGPTREALARGGRAGPHRDVHAGPGPPSDAGGAALSGRRRPAQHVRPRARRLARCPPSLGPPRRRSWPGEASTSGLRTSTTSGRRSTKRSSARSSRAAMDVQVEVAPKAAGDRGGIPVWADSADASGRVVRRLQVLEEFRLPPGFDANAVRVFNTNTFLVRAQPLLGREGRLRLVRGREEGRVPGGRAVRAPAPGAHGGDALGVQARVPRRRSPPGSSR